MVCAIIQGRENNLCSKKQSFLDQKAAYLTLEFIMWARQKIVFLISIPSTKYWSSIVSELWNVPAGILDLPSLFKQVQGIVIKENKGVKNILFKITDATSLICLISIWSNSVLKDHNLQMEHCGQVFSCDI